MRIVKVKILRFILAVIAILIHPLFSIAQDTGNAAATPMTGADTHSAGELTYFILDGSRSMWGRIGDKTKIESAKDALISHIAKLSASDQVGITAYGHRTESDCSDIEEVIPIGSAQRSDLGATIKSINPRGKSPISDAILQSVARVRDYPGYRHLILISDGVEACDKDPCVTVRSLKGQGIDFKIDVIGLSSDPQAAAQLSCIATESGGKYTVVSKADELMLSVGGGETIADTSPTPSPSPIAAVSIELPTDQGISVIKPVPSPVVTVASQNHVTEIPKERGKLILKRDAWLNKPFYWRLIDSKSGTEVARNSDFEEIVPTGRYLLAWRQYERGSTEIIIKDDVLILPNRVTTVYLNTALRINIPGFVKQPSYWGLRDPDSKEELVTFRTFESFLVPPGAFELIWRQYEDRAETLSFGTILIPEGRMTYITLASSLRLDLADWVPEEIHYWGLREPTSGQWAAKYYDSFEAQLVPPGKYIVVYRQDEEHSSDSQLGEVEIGEDSETSFAIDTGVSIISNSAATSPRSVQFDELDDEKRIVNVVRMDNPHLPMPLKPAHYRISYIPSESADDTPVVANEDFVLSAGEFAKINLDEILPGITADDVMDFDNQDQSSENPGGDVISKKQVPTSRTREERSDESERDFLSDCISPEPTADPYPEMALP